MDWESQRRTCTLSEALVILKNKLNLELDKSGSNAIIADYQRAKVVIDSMDYEKYLNSTTDLPVTRPGEDYNIFLDKFYASFLGLGELVKDISKDNNLTYSSLPDSDWGNNVELIKELKIKLDKILETHKILLRNRLELDEADPEYEVMAESIGLECDNNINRMNELRNDLAKLKCVDIKEVEIKINEALNFDLGSNQKLVP